MSDTLMIPCYRCGGILVEIADHLLECDNCKRLADSRLMCGACNGDLQVIDEKNGRKIFNCNRCHNNRMLACIICNLPKSIWADDGQICGLCLLKATNGEIELSPKQIEAVNKWIIQT